MEKIIELLNTITEETSIEEARRVVLEVAELCKSVVDDITAMKNLIDELTTKADDREYEIARLKEENGRIYRDRAEQIMENVERKADEIADKTAEETEADLMANIDI